VAAGGGGGQRGRVWSGEGRRGGRHGRRLSIITVNARWKIWRETILLAFTRRTTNSQQ
jgi:hypothetical protein